MPNALAWFDSNGPEGGEIRFIALRPEWTKTQIREIFKSAFVGDQNNVTQVRVVDMSALPSDPRFRRAWVLQGGNIVVDMAKAKALGKRMVRDLWQMAAPSLRAKKKYAEATADTADDAEAAAEIQSWTTLRNSTAIDTATTTEQIWAVVEQAKFLAAPYLGQPGG